MSEEGGNMKLIMKSLFDELRLNDKNEYDADKEGVSMLVRIYRDGRLIAKKKQYKNRIQYLSLIHI